AAGRETFDGGHFLPVGLHSKHQARADSFTVDEDGTRATNAMLAAEMRPCESQVVAQKVCQRAARFGQSFTTDAIDNQFNHLLLACHRKTSSRNYRTRCAASVKARRTSLVATYVRYAALAWTSAGGSSTLAASAAAATMALS